MISLAKAPAPRRFLSMANRVPNGEPINDALAAMQARRIELRPGTCTSREGVCDCLSGTTHPLVNVHGRPTWH